MSRYQCRFVAMICCGVLDANEYVGDLAAAMKSRLRKAEGAPFHLVIRAGEEERGQCYLETDEGSGHRTFRPFLQPLCAELAAEICCEAACGADVLKEQLHSAILEICDLYNMTPFFFSETAEG